MSTAANPELFRIRQHLRPRADGLLPPVTPATVPAPELLRLNGALATELGLNVAALDPALAAAVFAGNVVPAGATPIAQAYAGHQFGGFTPQLGDGRAVLLGEVIDRHGRRRDIALKGSGRTPFSRDGDGKAAVGPVFANTWPASYTCFMHSRRRAARLAERISTWLANDTERLEASDEEGDHQVQR